MKGAISMSSLEEKIGLLKRSGYRFVFDRDIYCNLRKRKCFSLEFVEDRPINDIRDKLNQPRRRHGLDFYFNKPPSRPVRVKLEKELIRVCKKSIK